MEKGRSAFLVEGTKHKPDISHVWLARCVVNWFCGVNDHLYYSRQIEENNERKRVRVSKSVEGGRKTLFLGENDPGTTCLYKACLVLS